MSDKSWMLNAKALNSAKACINIVKSELGVKLTLSHPDFLHMLHEYVDLTDSKPLSTAYARLLTFAGDEAVQQSLRESNEKIVQLPNSRVNAEAAPTLVARAGSAVAQELEEETIVRGGKEYPLYRDGKTFKGMYRGRPVYR